MSPSWLGRIAGELCADCALAGRWQEAYSYALKAAALRDPLMAYGGLAAGMRSRLCCAMGIPNRPERRCVA